MVLICISLPVLLPAQELDEIVSRHISEMGIDKVKDIKTYSMSGSADMAGITGPVKQVIKAPEKVRMEIDLNGQKIIQVINGDEGWMVIPMSGSKEPAPMEPGQVKVLKRQASLEGILYNWKEKGLLVTLEGTQILNNREVYRIKVVEESNQASVTLLFIDTGDFRLRAQKDVSYISGKEVISMTYFDNYREFSGILFPMRIESKMNGQTVMKITIGKVEVNQDIPDSLFEKPESGGEE